MILSNIFYRISFRSATTGKGGDPIQHYETTDIFLVSFLLCHGGDLSVITSNDHMIGTFVITGNGIHQLERESKSLKIRTRFVVSDPRKPDIGMYWYDL